MRLYLVRHGEATSKKVDPNQSLTAQGKKDVCRMADFLKKVGIRVIATWHSEKLRAIQTAQSLGEAVSSEIVKQDGLAPNDPVGIWLEELNTRVKDVMIVGHLPFLERMVSLLLVGNESAQLIAFRPGGMVCLEREEGLHPRGGLSPSQRLSEPEAAPREKWSLVWMVPPELV